MNYLIYLSKSSRLLTGNDLKQLLVEIRHRHNKYGITGMMLYGNGTFLQALEGDENKLESVFERLKTDDIQKGIIKLKSGRHSRRTFTEWSMGFKITTAEYVTRMHGFVDPMRGDFLVGHNPKDPAVSLLKTFAQHNLQY
jgi:hypothetical protein